MKSDIDTLLHAAVLLSDDAQRLREAHTLNPSNPDWTGEEAAKASHDELMRTAEELTAMANRLPRWKSVSDELPDDETTVMLYHPDASEPVWPGYREARRWRTAEGLIICPTHWAEMPEGPKE